MPNERRKGLVTMKLSHQEAQITGTRPDFTITSPEANFPPLQFGEEIIAAYEELCPACSETRWRRMYLTAASLLVNERTKCQCDDADNQDVELLQRQRLRGRVQSLIGSRNLLMQEAYKHMRFTSYQPESDSQRAAWVYMRNWTLDKGSVCLAGLPGRGKTHLAMAAAASVSAKGYAVLAMRAIDLLSRIRRCYQTQQESDMHVFDLLKTVDLLVLDDVGAEKATDWAQSAMYEIVDSRYRRKATIYTTNLAGPDLEKKLSPALASRIYGSEKVLILEGKDWRLANAAVGDEWDDIGEEVFGIP